MKKAKGKGQCFNKVYLWAEKNFFPGLTVKVCHGLVVGQGPIEGLIHGHAWLEDGDTVIDLQHKVTMSKLEYYKTAKLKKVVRYSLKQALQLGYNTGHAGPWNKDIQKVNISAFKKLGLPY